MSPAGDSWEGHGFSHATKSQIRPKPRTACPNEIDSNDCDGGHSLATLSTAMIRKPRSDARMQPTA